MAREEELAAAFVQLADTLVDDFDVIDLLDALVHRCVQVLDAAAAGLLLADPQGRLHVMAASTEQIHLIELFQLQNDEGPCLEAYRTGQRVANDDLEAAMDRWPRFAAAAREAGYGSVQALPLRLRSTTVGALNLFHTEPAASATTDLMLAQALADVATIGLLQARALNRDTLLAEQLQGALNSRVILEQAKGVVAEQRSVDPAEAFVLLRDHARAHHLRLSDYARAVVDKSAPAPDAASVAHEETPAETR
jgi:GAF domain-containing protein